jgi:hypothetical protein
VCMLFSMRAEPRERGHYLTMLTVSCKALRLVSSLIKQRERERD